VVAAARRDREYAERRAREAAEPKGDAPEGRQTVTGTILSLKDRVTSFGVTLKMIVKLENGARVWVTAPTMRNKDGGYTPLERGMTITFAATFTRSKDDRSFGFGKRPHAKSVERRP